MPSLDVRNELRALNINVDSGDNGRYNRLDTIESSFDLDALFSTLKGCCDRNGRNPVVTALSLSTNPDFEKILKSNFQEYHYESFLKTLEREGKSNAWNVWKQGIDDGIFYPEFHGREHLNVKVWMDNLKEGNQHALEAFKRGCWGFKPVNKYSISYQAAFDLDQASTLTFHNEIIKDGIKCFSDLHGRAPLYFVPPNGSIHQSVIDYSIDNGIEFISSPKIHVQPLGENRFRKKFRYLGQRGYKNSIYLTRNCFFEPSYPGTSYGIDTCLKQISIAFKCNKPAIISSHRVNYIGGLNEQNRVNGNMALNELFKRIVKNWPEVEFLNSVELGKMIRDDKIKG